MSSLSFEATGVAREAVEAHVKQLVSERFASRLFEQDAALWGAEAESEASMRLGWVDLFEQSRSLVEPIVALRDELRAEGIDRVVLAGMGGSSLAPEVITATAGVDLVVLDSTDPTMVSSALADRLESTVLVVSSKSGSTVETDSARRAFEAAFAAAGLDARQRVVIVTDPDSPMDQMAREGGYRAVFNANPHVGGRYSALTAFGLVPSGLTGVDLHELLSDAEEAAEFLREDDEDNSGLALGAALGGTDPLRDKIVFVDEGSGITGFADWIEQLIAESTGKETTGLLPVVVEPDAPEVSGAADTLVVRLVAPDAETGDASTANEVRVGGSLGGQLLLWEVATVVAGRLLSINPFDQPDVEAAKAAARGLLDDQPEPEAPLAVDGVIEIRGSADLFGQVTTVTDALKALLGALSEDGYVSIQAYTDRWSCAELAKVRGPLAATAGRPVTFGWGPRFLHSTGQFHKGGPRVGAFLQITAGTEVDVEIPERPFTFGELISAQATGDARVLVDLGRPVVRLHARDRTAGLAQIRAAVASLAND